MRRSPARGVGVEGATPQPTMTGIQLIDPPPRVGTRYLAMGSARRVMLHFLGFV